MGETDFLKDELEDDIIKKMYNNDLYIMQEIPDTEEYKEVTKDIIEIEKKILQIENENIINMFQDYEELTNTRHGIEAEIQFKIGFKTAIKFIIQSLK